ncbi:MAG: tail fiber domain-containing protein [Gammaproteobacteria bacterium]|nr:tail fiber domain-containing protein [Gammaproteobacteria bacterium]MDH5272442.1 tail fiber domain-containing protein [Gammaproteobacteria bacterium]
MARPGDRPRFFESQYLAADDLNTVVRYGHEQLAHHLLGPHTWGIVTGMYLVESSTPGAPSRRLVSLVPGVAVDGFARMIVVDRRIPVPESLFSSIPYDSTADDPATNNGTPPGRFVRVWIAYQESGGKAPAPGFERCDAGDQYARVREGYRFVIGDVAAAEQRSPVVVAGQQIDAALALRAFDAAAARIEDASIPQQQLPDDNARARWLIPVGYVRWVAYPQGGGYFVDRNLVATDQGDERIRRVRRYAGAVAEALQAADGTIVLRDRSATPTEPGKYQERLLSNAPVAETKRDLVWVEGNLRLVGDARIANGALRLGDLNGTDQQTPLYLTRGGDGATPGGNRELRAAIGPATQTDNRFVVGAETAGTPPGVSPAFVVVSNGDVGVGTRTPSGRLSIDGKVQPQQGRLSFFTTTADVEYDGGNDQLFVFKDTGGRTAFLGTKLGIGSTKADRPLAVRGADASQELVSLEAPDGTTKWHLNLNAGGTTAGLNLAETNVADGRLFFKPGGDVGIGTTNPVGRLTIEGKVQPNQGRLTFFTGSADIEYDGGNDRLFLIRDNGGQTAFMGTRLGLETTVPQARLHVVGTGDQWGTAAFVPDATKGVNISHFHWGPKGDCYVRSAATDGAVVLQDTGGNVGVGTAAPQDKLHVGGSFLRVDGAGNERAYIGGDGSLFGPFRDVQIGSTDASVRQVHFWNRGSTGWMDIHCLNAVSHSDERSKTDIRPLRDSLERVTKMRGVSFRWRQDPDSHGTSFGVIAQEVAKVVPEAVRSSRDMLGVSYNDLVALLIEALKELKSELDQSRQELESVKTRLDSLERSLRPGRRKGQAASRAPRK